MSKKQDRYADLVKKRKAFSFSEGLLNPSQIESGKYDSPEHIGPWSCWQGSIDAYILVVGQDWGDYNYYVRNRGIDDDNNPTCKNLTQLFLSIGVDIGVPRRTWGKILPRAHLRAQGKTRCLVAPLF